MRQVGRGGHATTLVVVCHGRVVAVRVRVHRAVVVHVSRVDMLLLLVMIRWLMRGVLMRRRPASRTIACGSWARHRSHIRRSSPAGPSTDTDTARHGLPSRQMTTVHLAGLGEYEAVDSRPLLLRQRRRRPLLGAAAVACSGCAQGLGLPAAWMARRANVFRAPGGGRGGGRRFRNTVPLVGAVPWCFGSWGMQWFGAAFRLCPNQWAVRSGFFLRKSPRRGSVPESAHLEMLEKPEQQ